MLCCLGLNCDTPTKMFGDGMTVIQNASFPASDPKKKHITTSCHAIREAVAVVFVALVMCTVSITTVMCSKQPSLLPFIKLTHDVFWCPTDHSSGS